MNNNNNNLIKKLLQNTAALRNFNEVYHPERTTQEKALEELVKQLCLTERLWLNNDEYDKLVANGTLVKNYRLGNLEGFILELVIKDTSEDLLVTSELENSYRHFISFDMIQSYRLKDDDVFTIHVKF